MSFEERIQNVKEHVDIFDVLKFYGVDLKRGGDFEQQIRCPFHGHRGDLRPSARVYTSSQKFHCFYCGFTLDVISFVQEYEGISFLRSLSFLEHHFNVPQIRSTDVVDDLKITLSKSTKGLSIEALLNLYEYCERLMINKKRSFDLKTYSKLFLHLDSIVNKLREDTLSIEQAFNALTEIQVKVNAFQKVEV